MSCQISDYLRVDFLGIATDVSVYACNAFILQKKRPVNAPEGYVPEGRLTCALQVFNKNTKDVIEHTPNAFDVVISVVGGKKYYFAFDVRGAYHHIRVHKETQKYLRFIAHDNKVYIWKRAPFGCKQLPSIWNNWLRTHLPYGVTNFFDDIFGGVVTDE